MNRPKSPRGIPPMDVADRSFTREKYDVFLSFRGPDIRNSFADCLRVFMETEGIRVFMETEGIRVFKDDDNLRDGESIEGTLREAICNSRISIPIFSRNYASSKCCLSEIAWMVDCMTEFPGKKVILPIFFDVEPDDVSLKTDLFAKALIKHEETSGCETVERWRKALMEVANISGFHRADANGLGKLIKQVTEHTCHELEIKRRILPFGIIGMEERVQDIMDSLDCRSRDVRVVVIYGMGGIGKTTLASVIFNEIRWQFEGCSFLSNVRESSAGNGILDLQNKLLRDILSFSPYKCRDANEAMQCIQGMLRNKTVLVVLDDVSTMDQIKKLVGMGNWLGLGSRVIITTRNLSWVDKIENNSMILLGKRICAFEMRELGFDNSLRLLCRHAFGRDTPPSDYEQVSHDILSLTGGVPLAIEVIGSYLRGQSVATWKDVRKKRNKVFDERLYQATGHK